MSNTKSSIKINAINLVIALVITVGAVGGTYFYHSKSSQSSMMTFESALYVTDLEIREIYPPGSPQQKKVLEMFKGTDVIHKKFPGYILYRMETDDSTAANEGLLMIGFNPEGPQDAKRALRN